jgi:uncharacterized membrane protein
MSGGWAAVRERLRAGFWAVPSACVTVAALLALVLVAVDRRLQAELAYTFGAGPDGAREVLSAITTAMITFTGLVFTITIVVLQLTSSQFSPRVLRTFLRDRQTQYALGVFAATFVYAVLVLRTVDSSDEDQQFVPAVSTTVAVALLLLSVALFVAYIHHITTAMQASSIIAAIAAETRSAIERRFPPGHDQPVDDRPAPVAAAVAAAASARAVLPARRSGVVTALDRSRLVELARAADVVLQTQVRLGDFVPEGAPLLEVLGNPAELDSKAVLRSVSQHQDRSMDEDVAFGFRQLCDVAERALSPSMNDPTTAVQVLDQLHDLLRRLATRPLRTGMLTDDDGRLRLVTPPERLADYLSLSLQGIDQYGADARPVQERIDALLVDVAAAALPEHRAAVEAWQERRRQR